MRYRLIPVLTFVLCGVLAWQIWRNEAPNPILLGTVDPLRADVFTAEPGIMLKPDDGRERRLYDVVRAGEEIARVRPKAVPAQMTIPTFEAPPATGPAAPLPELQPFEDEDIVLYAPIGGQITEIHRQPGQAVLPGQPIYTISSSSGITVTTYLRPEQRVHAERRMPVELRLQSDRTHVYRGVVETIGPELMQIPIKQRRRQQLVEWGLPVVVSLPPDLALRPGEVVEVRLLLDDAAPAK